MKLVIATAPEAVTLSVTIEPGLRCPDGHGLVNGRLEIIGKPYLAVRGKALVVKCPTCKAIVPLAPSGATRRVSEVL